MFDFGKFNAEKNANARVSGNTGRQQNEIMPKLVNN